jgi:hypothetical protein
MAVLRRRILALALLVTGTSGLLVGTSSSALAGGQGPLPPDRAGSVSSSSSLTVPGAHLVSPAALIGGVSGCYGQTDQPHPSSYVNGTVNTVARTVCPATDYVAIDQYRSRWYGWQSWGSGSNTNFGTATANAAGACESGDTYTYLGSSYLGSSYHEATGVGYAYTSNSRRFTCP